MKNTIFTLLFCLISSVSFSTETNIIVRAKAKDAKFIGSSIGGAYVMIKNKMTGEILAQGKTEGSTGNTDLIMNQARERYTTISDENTARFFATIDIDEPVFVTVEVQAPMNKKQATVHASTELWLLPGKHILGDGIVVEIPGFIIDVLEPRTHQYFPFSSVQGQPFKLQANVVMMCGCTINKNGLWDSEKIAVNGIVKRNGEMLTETELKIISTNLFEGAFDLQQPGQYEITIYAYDQATGNTGVDKVNFVVYE